MINIRPEPSIIVSIELSSAFISASSLLSVVYFIIYFEFEIMHTPPKLKTIAIASNSEIVSLKKHHSSKIAQNVAVFKMVIWATRGII